MSLPPYPKYKNSGVAWLGEVPEGWEVKRLRYISECLDGKRVPLNSEQRANRIGEIPYWGANSIMGYVDAHLFDETLILLGEDGAPFFDKTKNVAFLSNGPVWPNNHIHVLRPSKDVSASFVVFALNATNYFPFIDGSTRDKLTQGQMSCIPLALPLFPEQSAIAAFLDRETAKIDVLIAEQEKLITLLAEKRQATISHAVTKGLDPSAPMKDSGVAWLGEVPEGWDVKPLKFLVSFSGGGTPSRDNLEYWNGNIPWVSPKDMKQERIASAEESITELGLKESSTILQCAGQVLMVVRSGILKHTIPVAINDEPVALNQDMKALFFGGKEWLSEFFLRWVQGLNDQLLKVWLKQGATVESVEHQYLAETIFPFPCQKECLEIVNFLKAETARLDALTAEATRGIALLKERRAALISAAVTGKIDVREAV